MKKLIFPALALGHVQAGQVEWLKDVISGLNSPISLVYCPMPVSPSSPKMADKSNWGSSCSSLAGKRKRERERGGGGRGREGGAREEGGGEEEKRKGRGERGRRKRRRVGARGKGGEEGRERGREEGERASL